ncbi:ATP-binding cassette domain-containing protein [Mobilicoccus sp.]|uniref:ATP-binding cassette domain-containing protein n=1 Tax=Mobilicoccus sp. TaxID=2034349 RepID=UPI002896C311|nr:ATP-binding cassette domain-containing protein [Mobilicoccus sp.]
MNDKPIDSAVTSTGAAADIPRSDAGVTDGPASRAATAGTTEAASTGVASERAASTRAASEAGDITTSALAIRGLVKRFPGFTLDGIDLDVPRGYVVGLVGASGSGKTTTIGAAIGTIVPDEGQIAVPPMDRVGVVLDTPYFMRSWTPGRIEQAVRPFYPAWSEDRYRDLLARFRIRTSMRLRTSLAVRG